MKSKALPALMMLEPTSSVVIGKNTWESWNKQLQLDGLRPFDREEWMRFSVDELFSNKSEVKTLTVVSDQSFSVIKSASDPDYNSAKDLIAHLQPLQGSLVGDWVLHTAQEWNYFNLSSGNASSAVDISFKSVSTPDQTSIHQSNLIIDCSDAKTQKINFRVPELPIGGSAHISLNVIVREGVAIEFQEHHPAANAGSASVSLKVLVEGKASFTYRSVVFSKSVTKSSVHAFINEEARFTSVSAGVLTDSSRRHLIVKADHCGERSVSRQIHKAVLADRAVCEFDSQSFVRHNAKESDSHQLSRHILLSDDARVYANPRLKIETDEVVCGHGATVGNLDIDAIHYFTSRGISKNDAKQKLIEAFISEAAAYGQPLSSREDQKSLAESLKNLFSVEQRQ